MSDELHDQLPDLLPRLWRYALRLTGDTHDAQDLVQRCCERALEQQARSLPGSSNLIGLFAIAHAIWLHELRWPPRLRPLFPPPDPLPADPRLQARHHRMVAQVEALPDALRTVMLLVAVEGFSYREAAEVLGVPIGTVMSRLARARCAIAGHVGQGPAAPAQPLEDQHGCR